MMVDVDSYEGPPGHHKSLSSKFIHANSPSKRLQDFKERMALELNDDMVLGVDNLVKEIPEECVEYISHITDFI